MLYNFSADRLFHGDMTSSYIDHRPHNWWQKTRKMWYWCIVVSSNVFSWFLNPLLQVYWQEKGNYIPEQSWWSEERLREKLPSGHRGPQLTARRDIIRYFHRGRMVDLNRPSILSRGFQKQGLSFPPTLVTRREPGANAEISWLLERT